MKTFAIVDGSRRKAVPCGWLHYDEGKDAFSIDLSPTTESTAMPALLGLFVEKGVLHLDDQWTRRWLAERIPPSGRQNLGQMLKAHGLREYDEFALLMSSMGECAQDSFVLRPVTEEPSEGEEAGEGHASSQGSQQGGQVPDAAGPQHMSLAQSVGRQIAERRKELGISQMELASRTGVQQPVISRLERGQGNPTLELIEALAQGLDAIASIKLVERK